MLEHRNKEANLQAGSHRALIFCMWHLLVDLYRVCSLNAPGVKTGPALGVTS